MAVDSSGWLVLNFHGLGPPPSYIPSNEGAYWCTQDTFLSILDSIPEVEEKSRIRIGLTFDDGNTSDVRIATPALVDRQLRGKFFPCAGRIELPGYLDGSAMVEMLSAGMEIGSHGWSHLDWRRIDDATLTRETQNAQDRISQEIGQRVDSVAIPFGSYDRRVIGRLRAYSTIYTSDGYRTRQLRRIVPRLSYMTSWNADTLLRAASEPYSLARWLRHRLTHLTKRLR